MSAMAEAFESAGIKSVQHRLLEIAIDKMVLHPSSSEQASDAIWNEICKSAFLLQGLFEPFREQAVRQLMTSAAHTAAGSKPSLGVNVVSYVLRKNPPSPERYAKWEEQKRQTAIRKAAEAAEKERSEIERRARQEQDMREAWAEVHAAMSWYSAWRLTDGSGLGSARKCNLLAEAIFEENESAEHRRRKVFYERIANLLSDNETVNDALTPMQVSQIREEVWAAVPPS